MIRRIHLRGTFGFAGRLVPVVIGWEQRLRCGCGTLLGIRLDDGEPFTYPVCCGDRKHAQAIDRAVVRLRTMPPSTKLMLQLTEEILLEELR